MISLTKKTKLWVLPLISIILISSAVLVYARLHTVSYFDSRTVGNLTVYEFRQTGTEILCDAPQNPSNRITMRALMGTTNGGWKGYTIDLDNLNYLDPDPDDLVIQETDDNALDMSSKFQSSGSYVVWDEKHDFQGTDSRFDKIMLYNYNTATSTTISTNPYPSTISVHSPFINSNYVVYDKKSHSNANLNIYLYSITNNTNVIISPTQYSATNAQVHGNYVAWLDWRNNLTTGIDIYGYNINTHQPITISQAGGDQVSFEMNNRYLFYMGGQNNNGNMQGAYLYDFQNNTTSTITTNEVGAIRMSEGDSPNNTYICWNELVSNNNGIFWSLKYKKISDLNSSSISNPSTLNYCEIPNTISQEYIGWIKGWSKFSTGEPNLFKISDSTNTQLDETGSRCMGIKIGDEFVLWTRSRMETEEDLNVCGTMIP